MSPESLNPNPEVVHIEEISLSEGAIVLKLKAVATSSGCPRCRKASTRVHSRYHRVLHDLPWQGHPVRFHLATRRFFCDEPECDRRIFTERLAGVVGRSSRRCNRQQRVLTLLAHALGGEAGARVAAELAMPTSPDTLLRLVVNSERPAVKTPRVLGVDDWAFRKGDVYGTLLMDMETGEVIDLLPDRRAETLANWLKEHPGVEEIVRDRGGNYAEGARAGAPDAVQIADRWHLLRNMVEALEKLLQQEAGALQAAAQSPPAEERELPGRDGETQVAAAASGPVQEPGPSPESAPPDAVTPTRRQALYQEVQRRYAAGEGRREIARAMGLSRNTVAKYLAMTDLPPPGSRRPRRTPLTAHEPYLRKRWQDGEHTAERLWEEAQARGYGGSVSAVRRLVATWRKEAGESAEKRSPARLPSAKQVVWWLLGYHGRHAPPKGYLERLEGLAPRLAAARTLAARFWTMVRQKDSGSLAAWLEEASRSEIGPLVSLASSLQRDLQAVQGALESPWSTGPVEGQNNRLKMIKRTMYGRAGLKLLRARVLALG